MAKGGEFIIPSVALPLDIFGLSDLTAEQLMIRDQIGEFIAQEVTTDDAGKRIEAKDLQFSRELLLKLGQLGYLGLEIPEEYGGTDLGSIASALVAEKVARQASFACTFLAHTGIASLPIRFFGTEDQKKKYLSKLTSGQWVGAYSLTEAGAGSDAQGIKAKAILSEDGKSYVLTGEKIFVTNGGFADLYVIFAQVEGKGPTAFIVEKTFSGLSIGREEHKIGIKGSSTTAIILNEVHVPVENVLGEPGMGVKIALAILNLGRFKLAAASLGGARLALERSLQYSRSRKQFGQPIADFGAIRQKLARMATKIYAMEAVVYRTAGYLDEAARSVDTNDSRAVLKAISEFAVECSLIKVSCSEDLDFVVDENVQIHGGYGFCEEYPAARQYCDSRINRIFEGTNEVNRLAGVLTILKKAMVGGLPIQAAGKKIFEESLAPMLQSEPDDLVERLLACLNGARKAFLVVCDIAVEKFKPVLDGGKELQKHQAVLLGLADCMIEIYKMESVLAALAKKRDESGENLTKLVFQESFFLVEALTRKLIAMCSEGDAQRTRMAMVKRFLKFRIENEEELYYKITEHLKRL